MQTRSRIQRRARSAGKRQQGVIVVLMALALLPMLGLVGVALDGAHGMLNKSRLQNVVDAAALSAAAGMMLNEEFKRWGFPIDEPLFSRAYQALLLIEN